MKRYVITFLSVLVLGIIVAATGLLMSGKTGPVTIQVLGPTGDTWYKPHPQPIWRFTITNKTHAPVFWMARISTSDRTDTNYSRAGGFIDWPEGSLNPGQGLETNMIVPANTGSLWCASVDYWYQPTATETNVWPRVYRIPGAWRFFRFKKVHTFSDVWRQTTNRTVVARAPE